MNPQITPISADSETADPQSYGIIGAAMEVHRQLGHGVPGAGIPGGACAGTSGTRHSIST